MNCPEDAEAERRRAATAQAEELERKRALEEARLQTARDAERRRSERRQSEIERKRREWVAAWVAWGLDSFPKDAPREIGLEVHESVEEALAKLTPDQSQSVVQRLVLGAVNKALKPWQHQKEIERAVQESRKELPALLQRYFEPSEWEMRAMQAAREAISCLRADAPYEELRAAAVQSGRQIGREYEAEEARARAEAQGERDRQQREVNKRFLVGVGVACVFPYISKLYSDGEIWDEDLSRKPELEAVVRKALEGRLTGDESFDDAQLVAREVVDKEVE